MLTNGCEITFQSESFAKAICTQQMSLVQITPLGKASAMIHLSVLHPGFIIMVSSF